MISKTILIKKTLMERSLPINFDEKDANLFSHESVKVNPPTYLDRLQSIYANSSGLMYVGLDKLPQSLYLKPSSFKRKLYTPSFCLKVLFSKNEEIKEDVMWVTDNWSNNYFHWITDVLPRLQLIQNATPCRTLLIPKHLLASDFVKASLQLFDIQKLIEISRDQIIRCNNLLVVDTEMATGNYNESSIKSLRALYVTAYSTFPKGKIYERIYISRGKASRRKVINEQEIMPVLNEYGFHVVHMEDYSFEEQIKLIMPAKYIISNHGAGMTNMIFMQAGGSVFELRREGDTQNNCYFSLSSALSLNYYYQLCRAEPSSMVDNFTNITVSSDLFRKNVHLMLTQS